MILSAQIKQILFLRVHKPLAMWVTLQKISGQHGRGIVVFDAEMRNRAAELLGITPKTAGVWYKRMLDIQWAHLDQKTGKTYLRSGRHISCSIFGITPDSERHDSIRKFKVRLPDPLTAPVKYRRVMRNFVSFLYAAATKHSITTRKDVIAKHRIQERSGENLDAVRLTERTRKTSQSPAFRVIGKDDDNVRGIENFAPDNLAVRFDAARYGRHYSTISRYKTRACAAGFMKAEHRFHNVRTFSIPIMCQSGMSRQEALREIRSQCVELSVQPGFGIKRTVATKTISEDYMAITVQLTDRLIPNVVLKRNFGTR